MPTLYAKRNQQIISNACDDAALVVSLVQFDLCNNNVVGLCALSITQTYQRCNLPRQFVIESAVLREVNGSLNRTYWLNGLMTKKTPI